MSESFDKTCGRIDNEESKISWGVQKLILKRHFDKGIIKLYGQSIIFKNKQNSWNK